MGVRPTELTKSEGDPTTGIRARRPRPSLAAPPARIPGRLVPVLWGAVLIAAGLAVWVAVPQGRQALPEPWRATADPSRAAGRMTSEVWMSAGEPILLKLEWPAYPDAREYRLRIHDAEGRTVAPVTVHHPVFLYDLRADVLALPETFDWEVAAVLRDGSEIVAPPRDHPGR